MAFCARCGIQLFDDAKFCTGCGTQIPSKPPLAPAQKQSGAQIEYWLRSAEQGNSDAYYHLFRAYSPPGGWRDGAPELVAESIKWLRKCADSNSSYAVECQFTLAQWYEYNGEMSMFLRYLGEARCNGYLPAINHGRNCF